MMLRLVLFIFAVFLMVATAVEEKLCGISPSLDRFAIYNPNRIVGGEDAVEGDWPWFVYIDSCSATLISDQWILTAAHCVNGSSETKVRYGSVNWDLVNTTEANIIIVHPEYNSNNENDIALVKLAEPLELSDRIQPICLDRTVEPNPEEILTIVGWGGDLKLFNCTHCNSTKTEVTISHNILQVGVISLWSEQDNSKLIHSWGHNHAVWPGDSGGPLLVIRNNRWVQIGVCSGLTVDMIENERISMLDHSWHTKISYYCDWIEETTNHEVTC